MALDPNALKLALKEVDINLINQSYSANENAPPEIAEELERKIEARALGYANAIYNWILTATVNTNVTTNVTTLHPSGTINVAGSAAAQSNPLPVSGTGNGTGNGVGTLS